MMMMMMVVVVVVMMMSLVILPFPALRRSQAGYVSHTSGILLLTLAVPWLETLLLLLLLEWTLLCVFNTTVDWFLRSLGISGLLYSSAAEPALLHPGITRCRLHTQGQNWKRARSGPFTMDIYISPLFFNDEYGVSFLGGLMHFASIR